MTVDAKICGINSHDALAAAVEGGAAYVGFVFYPPSPRYLTPEQAAMVAIKAPKHLRKVGVFVDVPDRAFDLVLDRLALDMLQLHGSETPERVAEIKARYGLPIIKALPVAAKDDLKAVAAYAGVADWLMFDAKPGHGSRGLPGGNAARFDWTLLAGHSFPLPWFLSGGLDAANVAEAARITGARHVDVSSGVEIKPGEKDPARIRAFLDAVRAIDSVPAKPLAQGGRGE